MEIEALISDSYLAVSNTRRVGRALNATNAAVVRHIKRLQTFGISWPTNQYSLDCVLWYGMQDASWQLEAPMKTLTIGRAAEAAGVGVETIRFYERRGLIEQPRKPVRSGFRTYPDDVVPRLRFIRRAQAMGFSLDEIAELLSLRADPSADCGTVRERAATKLAEVDRKLGELHRMRRALEDVMAACPAQGALLHCTILEALEETAAIKAPSARRGARRQSTKRNTGMKSIELKVEGMHCDGCARTIEALVGAEEGVRAIAVTYKSGEARILFDPLRTSEAKLIAVIKRPGFRVTDAPST